MRGSEGSDLCGDGARIVQKCGQGNRNGNKTWLKSSEEIYGLGFTDQARLEEWKWIWGLKWMQKPFRLQHRAQKGQRCWTSSSPAEETGALPWPGQNLLLHFQFWKQFVIILQIPLKDLSIPMPGLLNIPAKWKVSFLSKILKIKYLVTGTLCKIRDIYTHGNPHAVLGLW